MVSNTMFASHQIIHPETNVQQGAQAHASRCREWYAYGMAIALMRTSGSKVLGVAHVPPIGERRLTVPLLPDAEHACRVVFTSAHLRSPAKVQAGSTDTRELGVRILHFDFRP